MEHLFLNKKLSLLAKEKGFDEPCLAWWDWVGSILYINKKNYQDINPTFAPLYQQIIDWFREKHNIFIEIQSGYYPVLYTIGDREHHIFEEIDIAVLYPTNGYTEYYDVLNKAIEEAFKLI